MNDTKETKDRVIATVRAAINNPAPRLIYFKHLSTLTDDETGYKSYGFEVNGVLFKTGWSDPEHYSFLGLHPDTSALDIHDLKLLLWWLEESDCRIMTSGVCPMTLTKEQTQKLLRNAYGFVDKYGVLLSTAVVGEREFELMFQDTLLVFSYDNTVLDDHGVVTFETHDGDLERFTVVGVATGWGLIK